MAATPVSQVPRIKLGSQGLDVSAQGLGCMGMSAVYGERKPDADMVALIRHAVAAGVTFLDTSDVYGPYTNELLLGKALQGGARGAALRPPVSSPRSTDPDAATHRDVDATDHDSTATGDGFFLYGRRDTDYILPHGAHRGHVELGIGIVAYSPLGRGFFSSGAKLVSELPDDDFRKNLPRFQPENIKKNAVIFERVSEMAAKKGCTSSQLALAWVHHQGTDVCPIPGTTKIVNFNQNLGALSVKLTAEEMAELESYAGMDDVQGDRYHSTFVNTWKDSETPPLSSWKAN
ncbi:hypothetical protein ACP4OV_017551 [Aristida adscensionis]